MPNADPARRCPTPNANFFFCLAVTRVQAGVLFFSLYRSSHRELQPCLTICMQGLPHGCGLQNFAGGGYGRLPCAAYSPARPLYLRPLLLTGCSFHDKQLRSLLCIVRVGCYLRWQGRRKQHFRIVLQWGFTFSVRLWCNLSTARAGVTSVASRKVSIAATAFLPAARAPSSKAASRTSPLFPQPA